MLTVLHVLARLPASGTERQLVGMLEAAHGRDWDAHVCALYPDQPLTADLRALGIEVTELSGHPASPGRVRALRRLVRSTGADVVHSSLWGANAYVRAAVLSRPRVPLVVSERRVEDFRRAPQRWVDRALRPVTDGYIGNSGDVADFVVRAHGVPAERVRVIRNGMDTSVFRPDGPAMPREPGRLRVGAVGRLVHQKGFDVLLEAVPALQDAGPVEVVVLGEGPDRPQLEAAAAGLPVSLPGAVRTPEEVAAFLRSLDVFVMPSRYEGLPNALLEAAACGLPVVATDVPGCVEAGDAVTRLVPVEDPAALAVAVLAVVGEGRGPVVPVATFAEVARAHLEVFEQALAQASRVGVVA